MKFLHHIVLYMALALGANAALALDTGSVAALRQGDMKKLVLHSAPRAVSQGAFERADGSVGHLSDFQGHYTLVNFWATWCPPCRKEMPTLSDLQRQMGGTDFQVVTITVGRNPLPAVQRFFAKIGVDNLPLNRDTQEQLSREMGVFGLPTTVLLDPQGREVARMQGDAEWNSDSAKAIIRALLDGTSQT